MLCLQLRRFPTCRDCWAVPTLLSPCSDHDLKGKVRQTTPPSSFTPWLSDSVSFACLMFDRVGNSWERRLSTCAERKHALLKGCLHCSRLPLFTVSTNACTYLLLCSFHHVVKFSCRCRAQTHSLAGFLEAACLLSSFSNYESLQSASLECLTDVILLYFDGAACSAPPVSPTKLLYCVKVDWKSPYK